MKTISIIILTLLLSTVCHSQIAGLMKSLNGKSVDFRFPYDSIKAQYKADSSFVLLDNGNVLNLDSLGSFFQGSMYGHYKSIKTKVDFYQNGRDTLMFTYIFYNDRLFEIDIYTNIDSSYKNFGIELEKFFKVGFIGTVQGVDKGHLSRNVVKRKTQVMSEFLYDKSTKFRTFSARMIYQPVRKYFPLWCGTDKGENWQAELDQKLNSH